MCEIHFPVHINKLDGVVGGGHYACADYKCTAIDMLYCLQRMSKKTHQVTTMYALAVHV